MHCFIVGMPLIMAKHLVILGAIDQQIQNECYCPMRSKWQQGLCPFKEEKMIYPLKVYCDGCTLGVTEKVF